MGVPSWVNLVVGAAVMFFGVYRIVIATRSREEDQRARERGGLFGRSRRAHAVIGILYILMGALLVLAGFGVHVYRW